MPANLTPAYKAAEQAFREARTKETKLMALEEMLAVIPKHKGTEKLRADIRKRLAKLREASEQKNSGPQTNPFLIEPQGAGQMILIGHPNCGKSSLVCALTNARPQVGEYPFTTTLPLPGMMPYKDILVQLVDTPPVTAQGIPGNLVSTLQTANGYLIVIDASSDECLDQLVSVMDMLRQRRLVRDTVPPGVRALTEDKCLLVANKCDLPESLANLEVLEELWQGGPLLPISALRGNNLEQLREKVFHSLAVIRIYTKAPGKEPDLEKPFVLAKGCNVMDLAQQIHHEVAENLKGARVWGSARFDGQNVAQDYVLADCDIVEIKS